MGRTDRPDTALSLVPVQGAAQEALEKYSKTLSAEYNSRVCRKLVRRA